MDKLIKYRAILDELSELDLEDRNIDRSIRRIMIREFENGHTIKNEDIEGIKEYIALKQSIKTKNLNKEVIEELEGLSSIPRILH